MNSKKNIKILFVVNVDWAFISHRLPIAVAAKKRGFEVHVAAGQTDKQAVFSDLEILFHSIAISRSNLGILNNFYSFLSLFFLFRRVEPDVIHLITIKPVLLGGLAARLAKVPSMVSAVPGLGYIFLSNGFRAKLRLRLVDLLYRLALGHTNSKVIFQNGDDQALVSRIANLPLERVARIRGSGVNLSSFTLQPLPEGTPVVMLAARLLADKGVREFVEAASVLRQAGQGARFVLVGEPDLDNPASLQQTELDAWQAAGLVELWGHRADMKAVLPLASVVVMPSYREGLPKVLIEAAACGRAVVTTDVPGCRDAIEPGVTGLLVPAKNALALADAISDLLADQEKCRAMGAAGRKLAEQAFDVNSVVEQHLAIYDELISKAQT